MKKFLLVSLLAVSVVALSATPGAAWHRWHGEVFIGIGAPIWIPPPPYYVALPPTVVVQQPPVYIQQPVPQQPPTSPTPTSYWYYCPSARAYYPYVQSCSEPWVPVPTRPPQ